MLFLPLAIGAGLGALGGFAQGRQGPQTQTTRSQLNPYGGGGNADFMLDEARRLYDEYTPWGNDYSRRAYQNVYGRGGGGAPGGGGGGGGGNRWLMEAGGGRRGGGGGGGGKKPRFLNWQATPNQYLDPIVSGQNLDIANNPYVQAMNQALADDAQVAFERALPGIQAQFSARGRLGSGASAAQQALAMGEMQRALTGQQAQTNMQAYQQAMDQMTQGLGMLSNETISGRNAWQADTASRRQANAQNLASRLNYAAQMAATAARSGDQRAALQYQREADSMRYALAMDEMMQRGAGQGWQNLQNLQGIQMPIMTGFGEQVQTTQGPKPNMFGSIIGGALGGLGAGMQFGGGGGGGGSWVPNQGVQAYNNFFSGIPWGPR